MVSGTGVFSQSKEAGTHQTSLHSKKHGSAVCDIRAIEPMTASVCRVDFYLSLVLIQALLKAMMVASPVKNMFSLL